MVFVRDPNGSFEDNLERLGDSASENFRNSATASGRRALDTFLGRRRVGPHKTETRTSHSVTIRSGGRTIGAINSWSHDQQKEIKENFFISPTPSGHPQEIIPLNTNTRTIKIARYELYRRPFEDRFGDFDLINLANQRNKFSIQEKLVDPNNRSKVIGYAGCYFTSVGYEYKAESDMVVLVNAEIVYLDRFYVSRDRNQTVFDSNSL